MRAEIILRLKTFFEKQVLHGADTVDEQTPLLALGVIDSLSMAMLLTFIHETFHVDIPNDSVTAENFENVATIGELVATRAKVDTEARVSQRSSLEQAVYVLETAGVASEWHELAGGEKLHCLTVQGEHPLPWVLLPGLGNPASSFGNMMKAASGDYSVAALDFAGFGLSTGGAKPHYRDHVHHVEQWLDLRYPGQRIVLIGSSAGCLVALDYARKHPDRVAALVLIGFGWIADPIAWMRELEALWQNPAEFLDRTFHKPPKLNSMLQSQFDEIRRLDAYRSYLVPEDLDPACFDGISSNVLLIGGSSDRIIGMDAIRAATERMKGSTLVELARCGHFPASERPEETVYTITSYLQEKRVC